MKRIIKKNGKTYEFTVVFHPAEKGGYWVSVPAIPGCYSQGKNMDEAKRMITEAIELNLECMLEAGEEIPDERGSIVRSLKVSPQLA